MMYEILYKFLIKHKRIDLPGIGVIVLQVKPAESRFVNQSFLPPNYFFVLERVRLTASAATNEQHGQGSETPSRKLFSWLAASSGISETEAMIQFNDFVFELKKQLDAGTKIIWNGIGVFQKESSGEIGLESARNELPWLAETVAKKVIRENAEHTMLVGETEKTSAQMTEILLNPKPAAEKRNRWWIWPLTVIIAIFIFLGWYFSQHGFAGTATGNNHKTSPAEAPTGYK